MHITHTHSPLPLDALGLSPFLFCLQVTVIPRDIVECRLLEKLNLNKNRLETVSEDLAAVKTLKYLALGNNKLTTLPSFLLMLPALETLQAFHNPILSVFNQPLPSSTVSRFVCE